MSDFGSVKAKIQSRQRKDINYVVAFGVAVISDLIDYGIGSVPFVGDIVDAVTIPILYRLIGPLSLFGLIEFIPGADLIPTYTLAVIVAWFTRRKK